MRPNSSDGSKPFQALGIIWNDLTPSQLHACLKPTRGFPTSYFVVFVYVQ
jgi:hypothetical protein